MQKLSNLIQFIEAESDRCVRCGLCLPYCPTYQEKKHEGESPRGRIMLLQGLASKALSYTPTAKIYLDHCLECGACETACPLSVKFGELFNAGKKLLSEN